MNRRYFLLYREFPLFIKMGRRDTAYDELMRELGFKTAVYHTNGSYISHHSLSEEEYTWFVLRYS